MGCTDPLRMGGGALHQCPLESVASYLIYADMRTFRRLVGRIYLVEAEGGGSIATVE